MIDKLFSRLTLRAKLQTGFVVMIGILFLVSTLIRGRMIEVRDEIGIVVEQHRPVELQANRLDSLLDDTAVALGQYLAVHKQRYIDEYHRNIAAAQEARDRLARMPMVAQNRQLSTLLSDVGDSMQELGLVGDELLHLAADEEQTFPGLKYANDNINPLTRTVQQLLTQMLLAEREKGVESDQEHYFLIADARYYWINVVSGVRAYLAYRSDRLLYDTSLYLGQMRTVIEKLSNHDDLDLVQIDGLAQLGVAIDDFDSHWLRLQQIHSSEAWRADSYLMKTRLVPLFEAIEEKHESFGTIQRGVVEVAVARLVEHGESITRLGDTFLLVGLVVGVALAWSVSHFVAKPIVGVAKAMEQIAGGDADLNRHLDAEGKDEIALLARSFNTFVDKARLSTEEEKALSRLLHLSLNPSDMDKYLNDALSLLIETVTWLSLQPKGGVFLVDVAGQHELKLFATYNFTPELLGLCAVVPFGHCMCGRAAESGEIEFSGCIDERHDIRFDGMKPHGHYSVPIMYDSSMLGVLVLYLPHGHERSEHEQRFLRRIAEVLSMGISLRNANADLLSAKQRAEAVNGQLTGIAANIPGTIFQCEFAPDGAMRYPFVGPGTSRLLGTDGDCPQDDVLALFRDIHPQDKQRFDKAWKVAAMRGESIGVEYRVRQRDGSFRWILCSAMPRRQDAGQCVCDGMLLDITERKNLEMQLLQAQKLESVGQLAAGIAHEINTPTQYVQDNTRFLQDAFDDYRAALTALLELRRQVPETALQADQLARVDGIVEDADVAYLDEEVPRAIDQSLDGLKRIAVIVSAMKEFSHPGNDIKTPIDINAVVSNIVTVSRNEWKYVAELDTELEEGLPCPPGYRDKLGQVLLNLIVNAAHAIGDAVQAGEIEKGRIVVSTMRVERAVEIRVDDNGPGVPDDIQQRIFDPFFTTKDVGKGTGQGLAIARSIIVDQHGGSLSLQSDPGNGATFIIRLPLSEVGGDTLAA